MAKTTKLRVLESESLKIKKQAKYMNLREI